MYHPDKVTKQPTTTINPNIHHHITKPNIMLDIPTQDLSDIEAELDDSDSEFIENDDNEKTQDQNTKTFTDDGKTEKTVASPLKSSLFPSEEQEVETSEPLKIDNDKSTSKTSVDTPTKLGIDEKISTGKWEIDAVQSTSNLEQNDDEKSSMKANNINDSRSSTLQLTEIEKVPPELNKESNEKLSIVKKVDKPSSTSNKELDEPQSTMKETDAMPTTSKTQIDDAFSIKKESDAISSTSKSQIDEASSIKKESDEIPSTSKSQIDKASTIMKESKIEINEVSSKKNESDEMSSTSKIDIDDVSSINKESDEMPSTSKTQIDEALSIQKESDAISSTSKSQIDEASSIKKESDEMPSTSKSQIDEASTINKESKIEIDEVSSKKNESAEMPSTSKIDIDKVSSKNKESDEMPSTSKTQIDEALSIKKESDAISSTSKSQIDEASSIKKESDEMPSTSIRKIDEVSSKNKESVEMPSTSKIEIDEASSKNKESDDMPSTSKVNEKLISDNDDEVQEITDSLGLLAESFRVMDEDEGDDDDDQDEDEDFDMYEETNSHLAEDLDSNSPTPGLELKDTVEPSPRPQESDEGTMDVVDDIEYVENEIPEMDIPDDVVSETPSNDENVEKEPEIIDADEHVAKQSPQKIISILEKVLGQQDKKTTTKSGKILNYVEIEGSSDSDDVQEVSKSDAAKDDVVSVNIPKGVEVMSTSAGSTSEILSKGDDVVISGVPKSHTPKKTTINTSEVSITTKPTSTPAIKIPEKSSTIDSITPKDEESINLDSDDEDTGIEKGETPTVTENEETTQELITDKSCLNPDCPQESTVYYDASRATAAFYSHSKHGVVCEQCRRRANERDENLILGIKDLGPLLELGMDAPSQQLVEISDSESEEDKDTSDDVIGEAEAKFLEEQLADMINKTWTKYNLDTRLKETEAYLMKELEAIEASAKEIDVFLDECQRSTDEIRVDFYKDYEPRRHSVGAIAIHDTPFSSYSLNERDVEEPSTEIQSGRYPKRKSSTTFSETPAKKQEISFGVGAVDSSTAPQECGADQRIDDDKEDIKVVKLSAESAPADLPPCGEIVRPPLKVGMITYAMRNAFGTWLKGRVQDILPKTAGQAFTQCRVKFEHKIKNPCKLLAARCLAYPEPSEVRMTIGTRLIAMFKDQENKARQDSFSSGVVAEIPNPVNNFRYLVFFDHGYAQYVHHRDTRLVCESSPRVWEEVHPFINDFIYKYLLSYPERPMVRLHTGEKLKTEWNGKWWDSKVMQVDASLALIHFDEDNRSEWIYRGSTRLAPLFLELQAAQKAGEGKGRSRLPRSKAQMRSNMPCVEYTREDAQQGRLAEVQETQNEMDMRRMRSVAKKSTSQAAPAPVGPTGTREDPLSRVVYYTPKNAVKPYKMVTHTCTVKCRRSDLLPLKELRTYNPLAKPLLSGWERQTVRYRGSKEVLYRAPCGRRLRNMDELHRYLRILQSDLSVDLFDFTPGTHCLAEFVLNKCIVGKKDLSHGKENMPVPCVNNIDNTLPEFCSYNTERTPTAGVPLNLDPDFLCGCDCTDDCRDKTKCACWKMTLEGARTIGLEGTNIGYEYRRLPEPLPSGIYECNSRCKCKHTCLNRVAQHPLQLKLQVFKTLNRGWGIRALNDIPKGAFICIYAGNLLTDATANLDGLNEGDEYLAELDYIEVVEGMKEGYEDDVPDKDKKLDKKSSGSESENELTSESEEERANTEDGDFQPGYIPQPHGQVFFKKSLRKREKAKIKEEQAKQEEMKKRDDTITISDDEEVREPSRFTAEAGMGNMSKHSSRVSVRTLFGKDEACYIMDAKVQGNIGRYLNHSCHPNVFVQNVFVDTHDPRFPWVAFFSLAPVRAGTELTWNYNYDIGSVPDKVLYCYCAAPNCRGRLL